MKLHGSITVNGRSYAQGAEIPWYQIYPFFLLHMAMFGASGFLMAYSSQHPPPVLFMYVHGGFAIFVYTIFYLAIFGLDEVKWMFINAGLGLLGIYSQLGWLLSFFGKRIGDYPYYVHVTPFLYFVLYTFLLRHAVLDITRARDHPGRQVLVENLYIAASLAVYLLTAFIRHR